MRDGFQHGTPSYILTASTCFGAGSFLANLEHKGSTRPHLLANSIWTYPETTVFCRLWHCRLKSRVEDLLFIPGIQRTADQSRETENWMPKLRQLKQNLPEMASCTGYFSCNGQLESFLEKSRIFFSGWLPALLSNQDFQGVLKGAIQNG